ncbi:MAG: serine/threonine-protein kinase [Acidobacteriota bacterium]
MTPERWRKVEELFHAARERGSIVLADIDPDLRHEVESLLAQEASRTSALDQPAWNKTNTVAMGLEIGHFRIEAKLGEGGVGTVYRAMDTKLNRPVAIKFLSDERATPTARRRFQREAQLASSLNHPHIVTVFDVGELGMRQYIVTEFVDGVTLADWIKEARTWRQSVELLTGIADALAAAHAAGILHRDTKPTNILVARNGYAKLADFGLAKLQEAHKGGEDETQTLEGKRTLTGTIIGTPAYMSPEQAAAKTLDARSDVFSFGVVLYEMLSGRRPFSGGSHVELLHRLIHSSPDPLPGALPGFVRAIVEKALEKDPANRYQSMRDMVVDLKRAARQPEEVSVATARSMAPPAAANSPPDIRSIAVLPLINISSEAENEYICDGLAEELINELTQIEDLRVVSRSSSFQCKGTTPDVREAGRRLGATLLVHGSLRCSGENLRLSVQLSDAQEGFQLWSQRFDAKKGDLFALQDELSAAVLAKLRVQLGSRLPIPEAIRPPANAAVYALYLQAKYAFNQETPASLRQALDLFQRATAADPSYVYDVSGDRSRCEASRISLERCLPARIRS